MANTIPTPKSLVTGMMAHLENEMVLAKHIDTDLSSEFAGVGSTVYVERPQRFVGQEDNLDITNYGEDLIGGELPVTMDKTHTIRFDLTALEMTLDITDSRIQKKMRAAAITLKDKIETSLASNYWRFGHFSGTPGTTPNSFKSLGLPDAILTDGGIPSDPRLAFHNTTTALELADSLKGVYVSDKAKAAFEKKRIGHYGGFENVQCVHIPTHTVGDYGGTPAVAGANQDVNYVDVKDQLYSELNIDGGTNSTVGFLKRGDVIEIPGVYAINPVTRQSTGRLQTFTLYEDADTDGSGATTIKVSPAIIVPSANPSTRQDYANTAFATVSAAPADNAPITVKTGSANSTHAQSLLLHPKALTLVSRKLKIKANKSFKTTTVAGNKVTISMSEGGNINTLDAITRYDMLWGTTSLLPCHGLRLTA